MNDRDTNYSQETIEISPKDLLLSVLLYWKKILIAAVVVAVLVSGYVGVKGLSAFLDKDSATETREEYQRLVEDYERNSAQIQKKIEDIESELVRQEKYRETSVMLLIDPYDVHTEKVSYYVDTNYEIAPNQYYQSPDYTLTLADAYALEVDGIDFDDVISESSGRDLSTHNPVSGSELKLVNTEVKPESGIIDITIYGDTDEQVDLLRQSIDEILKSKKADYDRLIGPHNLEMLSDTKKVSVNKDFVTLRETFNANFDTLSSELDITKKSLSELEMPANNVPSKRNIVKRVIKYFILGGALGLFFAIFITAAYLVLGNKLLNPEEITHRFGLPILGTFTTAELNGLSRSLSKLMGISLGESREACGEYIASRLDLLANDKTYDRIVLIGPTPEEDINVLKEVIEPKMSNLKVDVAGNINKSPKALDELKGSNIGVVCVEKCQKSSFDAIESELQIIRTTNHDIIGAVVLV